MRTPIAKRSARSESPSPACLTTHIRAFFAGSSVNCLGCGLIALAGVGCSTTDPDTIDRDFGNSVRRMVEAQKYIPPSASTQPMTMDGPKAQEVLAAYRRDVAKPKRAEQPIQVVVGGK